MRNSIKDFYNITELQGKVVSLDEVYTHVNKHGMRVPCTKEVDQLSVHIYIENDSVTLYPKLKSYIEKETSVIFNTSSKSVIFTPLNVLMSTLSLFSTTSQQEILVDIHDNTTSYRILITPQVSPEEFTIVDIPDSDYKFLTRADGVGNIITAGILKVCYDISEDTTTYYICEIKRKEENFINRFSKAILTKREEIKSNSLPTSISPYFSSESLLNFSLVKGAGVASTLSCNPNISKENIYHLYELDDFSDVYNFADPVSIKRLQRKFPYTIEIPEKQKSTPEEIYKLLKEIFTKPSNNLIIIDDSHLLYLLIPVLTNSDKEVTKCSTLLVDKAEVTDHDACLKVLQDYLDVKLF